MIGARPLIYSLFTCQRPLKANSHACFCRVCSTNQYNLLHGSSPVKLQSSSNTSRVSWILYRGILVILWVQNCLIPNYFAALSLGAAFPPVCPSRVSDFLELGLRAVEAFNLEENIALDNSNWGGGQIWGLKVKGQGHWERICKHVYRAYLRQKRVDLRETKIKMITDPFYTHVVKYNT